jgi:hypothetical protein
MLCNNNCCRSCILKSSLNYSSSRFFHTHSKHNFCSFQSCSQNLNCMPARLIFSLIGRPRNHLSSLCSSPLYRNSCLRNKLMSFCICYEHNSQMSILSLNCMPARLIFSLQDIVRNLASRKNSSLAHYSFHPRTQEQTPRKSSKECCIYILKNIEKLQCSKFCQPGSIHYCSNC